MSRKKREHIRIMISEMLYAKIIRESVSVYVTFQWPLSGIISILDSLTAQNLNITSQKTTGRAPAEMMFGTFITTELDPKLNNEVKRNTREDNDVITIREGKITPNLYF